MPQDIPGYYFDEEKNRYFPNSYKRKRETKDEVVPVKKPKKRKQNQLVTRLMLNRETYGWNSMQFNRLVMEASSMKPQVWMYIDRYSTFTAVQRVYTTASGTEALLTGHSTGAILHGFSNSSEASEALLANSSVSTTLRCKPPSLTRLWQISRNVPISSITSSATQDSPDKPTIISTLGSGSVGGSMIVANLNSYDVRGGYGFRATVWTAQCFPCGTRAALGSDKNALILNMDGKTICKYKCQSDVLTQTVDSTGDNLLCGLRNGSVLSIDVRERKKKMKLFQLKSSVCSMSMLKDQNYVVASAMNGSIGLWDRRMTNNIVRSYEGQVNTHSRLGVAIDPTENLLVSGGEDRAVRVWSLQTGELLRVETGFSHPPSSITFQDSHDRMWRAWFDVGNSLYCMQGSLLDL